MVEGGYDSGATFRTYLEKDLALQITLKIGAHLAQLGHEVMLSRTTDKYLGITERCKMANNAKVDAFISIHLNADPDDDSPGTYEARGQEIFIYPGAVGGRKLAESVERELKIRFPDEPFRGIKESKGLGVLRLTKMPAILIEVGFIDNSATARQLSDDSIQSILAASIAASLHTASAEVV